MSTTVPNGRVEVVVAPDNPRSVPIHVTIRLWPNTGTLRGPLRARVLASGIPHEVLVAELDPGDARARTASAGQALTVTLSWDARDTAGIAVPADAYSFVCEVIDDQSRVSRAGATLVLSGPAPP